MLHAPSRCGCSISCCAQPLSQSHTASSLIGASAAITAAATARCSLAVHNQSLVEAAVDLGARDTLQGEDERSRAQWQPLLFVDVPDRSKRVRHLAIQLPVSCVTTSVTNNVTMTNVRWVVSCMTVPSTSCRGGACISIV